MRRNLRIDGLKMKNRYKYWDAQVELRIDESESDEEYLLDFELKDTLGITAMVNESEKAEAAASGGGAPAEKAKTDKGK